MSDWFNLDGMSRPAQSCAPSSVCPSRLVLVVVVDACCVGNGTLNRCQCLCLSWSLLDTVYPCAHTQMSIHTRGQTLSLSPTHTQSLSRCVCLSLSISLCSFFSNFSSLTHSQHNQLGLRVLFLLVPPPQKRNDDASHTECVRKLCCIPHGDFFFPTNNARVLSWWRVCAEQEQKHLYARTSQGHSQCPRGRKMTRLQHHHPFCFGSSVCLSV